MTKGIKVNDYELKISKWLAILRFEESNGKLESPKPKGVQRSITEFYRSAKVHSQAKSGGDLAKDSNFLVHGISKEKKSVKSQSFQVCKGSHFV